MAAGFPGNSQGIALTDKGGPQIQSPMGAYIASRAGLGGFGGGFTYGPTSPYKKRGYQLTNRFGGSGPGTGPEGGPGQITGITGDASGAYLGAGPAPGPGTGPPGGYGTPMGGTQGYGGANPPPIKLLRWGDNRPNPPYYIPGMDQFGNAPPRNVPTPGRQQQIVNAATNARNARPMMAPMTTGFGDTGTSSPDIIRRFLMAKGLM